MKNLKEQEREVLKTQVIVSHTEERVAKVKEKCKGTIYDDDTFYDSIAIAAQIDISQRSFGDKIFDGRLEKAVGNL